MDSELLDSLSAYEVAILTFTSPAVVDSGGEADRPIVLTGKDAYLWAGAVAHVLVHRPALTSEQVLGFFGSALEEFASQVPHGLLGPDLGRPQYYEPGLRLVELFLRTAGIPDNLNEVYSRTNDAIRSLEWRGLIEDPFRKKLATVLLSVALILPVSFTESTEAGSRTIEALTWKYAQTVDGNRVQREFRVKVREIADSVLHKLVPAVIDVADKLSPPPVTETTPTRELQQKLHKLGYYRGAVDGKPGAQTVNALRQFQFEHHLPVTGYLDARTILLLKNIST